MFCQGKNENTEENYMNMTPQVHQEKIPGFPKLLYSRIGQTLWYIFHICPIVYTNTILRSSLLIFTAYSCIFISTPESVNLLEGERVVVDITDWENQSTRSGPVKVRPDGRRLMRINLIISVCLHQKDNQQPTTRFPLMLYLRRYC